MSSSPFIHVYALPKFLEPEAVQGDTAVAVDVLRATTTMITALAAGAREVYPRREVDETFSMRKNLLASGMPSSEIVLGGERGGILIEGFDCGNSPEEYSNDRIAGKSLLFTTTNGTRAVHRAAKADHLFLAGFVNAGAVVRKLLEYDRVHIVCAGTDGMMTEEDLLLAGCLTERLDRLSERRYRLNVQASAAMENWKTLFSTPRLLGLEPIPAEALARHLRQSRGGRNLMELGLGRDILAASRIDTINAVPEFREGRIVLS